MPTDETVEDLLRRAFEGARGEGHRLDLHGLHAGARERAQRWRRRRALLTTAGSGLAAAAVVAAVVVGPGLAHGRPDLVPATSTPAPTPPPTAVETPAPAAYGGAYEIPDVLPEHLPAGLALPPAAMPMHTRDPQLLGNAGTCSWSGDMRRPVAGRDWQLYDSSSWRAGLSIAGFTTGTG